MHEGVVPGVEEEILLPAFPVVRAVLDGSGSQHFGDRFQELERNEVEARLSVCAVGAAGETPDVVPFVMMNLAHSHHAAAKIPSFPGGRFLPSWKPAQGLAVST